MGKCRGEGVTEKGSVLRHAPELPKVYHQRYLQTWVFFLRKQHLTNSSADLWVDYPQIWTWVTHTYPTKSYSLADTLPKTSTERTVCRHNVSYSFSLLHRCYFQPRLENQHIFFYLICLYASALHIKFLLFQKFMLIVIPELLLYSGTPSLHSLPFVTKKRENNSFV